MQLTSKLENYLGESSRETELAETFRSDLLFYHTLISLFFSDRLVRWTVLATFVNRSHGVPRSDILRRCLVPLLS